MSSLIYKKFFKPSSDEGTKRLSKDESDRLYKLCAAIETLDEILEPEDEKSINGLQRRLQKQKAWSNARSALGLLARSLNEILLTVPNNQVKQIDRQLPTLRYKIVIGRDVSFNQGRDDGFWMSLHDLNVLGCAACEQCISCIADNQEARSCELQKVLDLVPNTMADYEDEDCPYRGIGATMRRRANGE